MRRTISRRKFVGKSLGALAPLVLADLALAEEVQETPTNSIEIPGLGRFSLNPEDYDADSIANLFGKDFAGATQMLRQQYDDTLRAITTGDQKKLAAMADPLVRHLTRAEEIPLVGDGIKKALLAKPQPELISDAAGQAAPMVYFINGMFTTQSHARQEAKTLATQLPGHRVSLFYNEGTDPRTDSRAAGKDLEEAFKDRVWPLQLTRMLRGKSVAESLKAAAGSTLDGGSPLQHNPTTRQLAGLLHQLATEMPTAKVALVGYSQGALIARNALYTIAILGHEEFAVNQVALVAPGTPINDYEVWPLPKKFTPIVDPQDPVPSYLGLQGSGFNTRQAALSHHWFEETYVKQIKPEMF